MSKEKPRWIKCLVLHKDDSSCGHEVIHIIGKKQDYCPVCMENVEKAECVLCKIRKADFHACNECIKRELKDFDDSTLVWVRKKEGT
jgi:hypothetical protein